MALRSFSPFVCLLICAIGHSEALTVDKGPSGIMRQALPGLFPGAQVLDLASRALFMLAVEGR